MATKSEITDGIRQVEERLQRLLPGIRSHLETPLPEGTWSVHDALCHLAADSNAVPRWLARIEALDAGRPARAPGFNMDEHNQQNIDARKGKPIDEVVSEVTDGLHADAAVVGTMDEALLQRQIPNFRGEMVEASEMLSFSAIRHNNIHLDDIEHALTGASPAARA
ncbi:MAG TPA: hypothetical protein VFY10_08720 [Dehalococcoidia bacterium]|nr:hypothetical protein [Dehalococcoidia bacterium]